MNILPYDLIGWGIDMLYIWVNGIDKEKSYAIVHSVQCINPRYEDKKINTSRELEKIHNCDIRDKIWSEFAKKHNIPWIKGKKYNSIPLYSIKFIFLKIKRLLQLFIFNLKHRTDTNCDILQQK
jgi:hypothetical protein